jgi:sugar phosphate isomerase/epimerase
MIIDLTIHSFSFTHRFRHVPGYDALSFIDDCRTLGCTGVALSLNDPNYRHLGGREERRMDAVAERLAGSGMSLEIDTSGTEPEHLRTMIRVARRMGAASLRFYTRHRGSVQDMMRRTVLDLLDVTPFARDEGVVLVIENHEDFTGAELSAVVEAVDHPNLGILFDFGNSQMVLEDPLRALAATLPHVHSVHVKDHVMIRPEHSPLGALTVAGSVVGRGYLPITEMTRRLLAGGLRRLTFESVWGYTAPIANGRSPDKSVVLGAGAFRYAEPPFDPTLLLLDTTDVANDRLVELERQTLAAGFKWFRAELEGMGVEGYAATSKQKHRSSV